MFINIVIPNVLYNDFFFLCCSNGYRGLTSLFYLLAVICVLYCQESIYRLNAVIPVMFMVVAIHQLVMPKFTPSVATLTPDQIALSEKVQQFKKSLVDNED